MKPVPGIALTTWLLRASVGFMAVLALVALAMDIRTAAEHRDLPPAIDEAPGPEPGAWMAPTRRPVAGDQVRPFRPGGIPRGLGEALPLLLPESLPGLPSEAPRGMSFRFLPAAGSMPGVILATGPMLAGATAELRSFDRAHGEAARALLLVSPGGSVRESLEMGRYVRGRRLHTVVPPGSQCASACPTLLAAGIRRVVFADSWIGLHQASFEAGHGGDAASDIATLQTARAREMRLLAEWGVSLEMLIPAFATPPGEIYYCRHEELLEWGLATHIVNTESELAGVLGKAG